MPTYEYLCEKCGFEFEREQRITENPIKTCPKCKARKVKRLLSAAGFILKGGGWYADGYGSASRSSSSPTSESSDSSSSGSGGSDTGSGTSGGSQEKAGTDKSKDKGTGKAKSKQSAA